MLSQNPRQADFVLGTCPHCQKVVRIPVTAVTSQSKSQVRCPMCSEAFEIAEVLEETIPSVEVLDDDSVAQNTVEAKPEKINAIDTPDLFHVSKEDYQPKTEKKNGRFVVPDLLSKGSKGKKKKGSRRKSRRSREQLEESLARLKKNTASTTVDFENRPTMPIDEREQKHRNKDGDRSSESGRSRSHRKSRSGRSRKRSAEKSRSSSSRNPTIANSVKRAWHAISGLEGDDRFSDR